MLVLPLRVRYCADTSERAVLELSRRSRYSLEGRDGPKADSESEISEGCRDRISDLCGREGPPTFVLGPRGELDIELLPGVFGRDGGLGLLICSGRI